MSTEKYTPEFEDEAVRQVIDRGYSVAEVANRLGVSAHSLHKWVKAVKPTQGDQPAVSDRSQKRKAQTACPTSTR